MIAVIVPCYNEAARLDLDAVSQLFEDPGLNVILVDDGSTDDTRTLIESYAAQHPGAHALILERNGGKAEAVRRGLLHGLEQGASIVGYLDADMATPPHEMLRLVHSLKETDKSVVLGARVRMLGHEIRRAGFRHYLGRLFATVASLALGLPVYDTQCGAKVFRAGPALRRSLATPFGSRWAFDVELLARLTETTEQPLTQHDMLEVPLSTWADREGSKLTASAMVKAALDLFAIYLRRKRSGRSNMTP